MYDRVAIGRLPTSEFFVSLDGKNLRTPAQKVLALPTEELAWGIAVEWEAQGSMLRPDTMPLMKLATTAVDQVPEIRPTMTDSMLRCLNADSACFRSVEEPALAKKEEQHYGPLLKWLRTGGAESGWPQCAVGVAPQWHVVRLWRGVRLGCGVACGGGAEKWCGCGGVGW